MLTHTQAGESVLIFDHQKYCYNGISASLISNMKNWENKNWRKQCNDEPRHT